MNKIRLTESQLHKVISESVRKVLNEDLYPKVGEWSKDYSPYIKFHQTIPNEVYGLVQRVENLAKKLVSIVK